MAEPINGTTAELDELGFRKDAAQPQRPIDWPYDGPRTATITKPEVQAHELFSNVYDDLGKQVRDNALARQYAKGEIPLPPGYTIAPQMGLVLNMMVDDTSIPVPRFPVTIPLGDTTTVELGDDGRFRFVNAKGYRLVATSSTLLALCKAIAPFDKSVVTAINAVVDDPERWYDPAMFEGLELDWDVVAVSINSNKAKDRAWPVGAAGTVAGGGSTSATTSPAAASGATALDLALAADGNAQVFQQSILDTKVGGAPLLAAVLQDAEAAMNSVLEGANS